MTDWVEIVKSWQKHVAKNYLIQVKRFMPHMAKVAKGFLVGLNDSSSIKGSFIIRTDEEPGIFYQFAENISYDTFRAAKEVLLSRKFKYLGFQKDKGFDIFNVSGSFPFNISWDNQDTIDIMIDCRKTTMPLTGTTTNICNRFVEWDIEKLCRDSKTFQEYRANFTKEMVPEEIQELLEDNSEAVAVRISANIKKIASRYKVIS